MFHVVCASTASDSLTKVGLELLLEQTHRTNTQGGITGMLLYKDGCFLQAIESEKKPQSTRVKEPTWLCNH